MMNCKNFEFEKKEVLLSEIVFDEKLYPRKSHEVGLVQQYAETLDAIEELGNYIVLDQHLNLLDGRHRHLAYQKKNDGNDAKIPVRICHIETEADRFAMAVQFNCSHGKQLTPDDKKQSAISLYANYR